jgi:hypothetical protein
LELNLKELEYKDEISFTLIYPKEVLLPNNYMIHIDIHLPNVCFYDRQDTCSFNIYDNGTDFLKYSGENLGFVMLRPKIMINE